MKIYKNNDIFKNKVKCIKMKEEEKKIKKEEKMDSILDDEFMKTYYKGNSTK